MNKKFVGIYYSLVFFCILLLVPLFFAFNKTGQRTFILGKNYSILNKSQILGKLQKDFILPSQISFQYLDQNFTVDPSSISASINYEKTASTMLFRRLNKGLVNYIRAFLTPSDFSLEVDYSQSDLDQLSASIVSQINKPFVPSEFSLDDKKNIIYKAGQLGKDVNIAEFKNQIIFSLTHTNSQISTIIAQDIGYIPTQDEITTSLEFVKKLVNKSIVLKALDNKYTIDDKTLISWMDFNSSCKQDKIREYANGLSTSLDSQPIDAVFKFENNKVIEFKPARDGKKINLEQFINDFCSKIILLINGQENTLELELTFTNTPPKINNSDVNNLGIKELLGKGVSTFKHSNATRNMNVEKGSSVVNNILVAPGETFSFIKNLGPVSLDAGFKKAYVIKAGKTELDVGGGVCQVSTTLFRAMLDAGLNITERKNHAYRVGYYEEDSPSGFDATVFIPSPDLKFINDTGHYVLVQNIYDGVNKKLTYEIYGTSDGRVSEITNYRKWDASPAPPAIYIEDPTLPPGKTIQDEQSIAGLKTAFDWKVTKNGQILHQKTFTSVFTPWAAVYRRGPQQ